MEIFRAENIRVNGDTVTTENWHVPETLFYFNGHFPHNPVLPAVAIVDLSVQLIQRAFPENGGFLESVPHAKFSIPLRPLSQTLIRAEKDASGEWSVEWKDRDTHETAAQLRLRFFAPKA